MGTLAGIVIQEDDVDDDAVTDDEDDYEPVEPPPKPPMSRLVWVAIWIGVAGVAWGTVSSLKQLAGLRAIFTVPAYADWMLGAVALGLVAIVLGLVELVHHRRWKHATVPFLVGGAAIVTRLSPSS
jgi:hypothetical protein